MVPGPWLSETLTNEGRPWRSGRERPSGRGPLHTEPCQEHSSAFCPGAWHVPPHPALGQLMSQVGSEDLVEEEAKIGERAGVQTFALSWLSPRTAPLHDSLSVKAQAPPSGVCGRGRMGFPTHQLLTRDNQSKKNCQGPEQHHRAHRTAEETRKAAASARPTCCQVTLKHPG